MKLVIIESPGKLEALKKYLGKGYDVVATKGHIRDLPVKKLAVDVSNNFEPKYEIMPGKERIIKELKDRAKVADEVLLATDPDREGEAISWHVEHVLGIDNDDVCRVTFNEISEPVVNEAVKNPRKINMDLVHAQQGRRVLDRLVGYKLSPIICRKIKSNLSAGRVQSVALELIVDRENEIKNFKPKEYWIITCDLKRNDNRFKATLATKDGVKFVPGTEKEALKVLSDIKGKPFIVRNVKKGTLNSNPPPPFTTSTMQQDALNKLGMSVSRTTKSAQSLYEGVELGNEGKVALVTYIRTDSTRVSTMAQMSAKEYIMKHYGKNYVPPEFNVFKSKKNIQDAHEAIRPINLERSPDELKEFLSGDIYRLYKLIYERFIASQMSQAIYNVENVNIVADGYGFKAYGKTLVFPGFTRAYKMYEEQSKENEENAKLCTLYPGEMLSLVKIDKEQKFTKPPYRLTEASLIKVMEEKGIGRPATYAPTIMVLFNRRYMQKDGKFLIPTELGIKVTEFLKKYFENIMNVSFTAKVEDDLDKVEEGSMKWQDVIKKFYSGFEKKLDFAFKNAEKVKFEPIVSDVICEKCGAHMVIRQGRYGKFLACPNYPACKNIKPLNPVREVVCKCPECGKDVVVKYTKRGKLFYGCTGYPKCTFASWEKPTDLRCPKCKSYLTVREYKTEKVFKCSNHACDFIKKEKIEDNEEKEG